jgi:hypothetical protein
MEYPLRRLEIDSPRLGSLSSSATELGTIFNREPRDDRVGASCYRATCFYGFFSREILDGLLQGFFLAG